MVGDSVSHGAGSKSSGVHLAGYADGEFAEVCERLMRDARRVQREFRWTTDEDRRQDLLQQYTEIDHRIQLLHRERYAASSS